MIIYECSEDDVNWVQRPSTFHILYMILGKKWLLCKTCFKTRVVYHFKSQNHIFMSFQTILKKCFLFCSDISIWSEQFIQSLFCNEYFFLLGEENKCELFHIRFGNNYDSDQNLKVVQSVQHSDYKQY